MGISILDRLSEAKKEEKAAELRESSERAKEQAKHDEQERRAYERDLMHEKAELLKMKQGLSDGEEFTEKEEPVKKEYTLKEKIDNFFYHYKFHTVMGVIIAGLLFFLIRDYVTAERPDVMVLFLHNCYDMQFAASDVTEKWSGYTDDLNHDRKKCAKLYYAPATYTNDDAATQYLAQADRTKIVGEFQSGTTIIVIGSMEDYKLLGVDEGVFDDATQLFPGDPNAEKIGYRLSGTRFKEMCGIADLDDEELYVSFRTPVDTFGSSEEKMRERYDCALAFFRAYLQDNRAEPVETAETQDSEQQVPEQQVSE